MEHGAWSMGHGTRIGTQLETWNLKLETVSMEHETRIGTQLET
jgi:hypothetical protein